MSATTKANSGQKTDYGLSQRAYTPHDHSHCIDRALLHAEELCQSKGERLTTLRKQVLELVWDSHKPVGAYDVLAMMSKDRERPIAPPTVYRALDFLLEHGLIHKLNSLNAYIGCQCPGRPHEGIFLICEQCRTTRELDSTAEIYALKNAANQTGFLPKRILVELTGLCPACQSQQSAAKEQ